MQTVNATIPSRMREPAMARCPELRVGRYSIFGPLAAGGMATVHLARLVGSAGFSRVVAAKRMHRDLLLDPEFKEMFLDEARLAARVVHPNVVPVLDVISYEGELLIVMDYVHGAALHVLMRTSNDSDQPIPVKIGCAIIAEALHGLHAAHEARDEKGTPLNIVHRDVSPQNILVGSDGVARVLDFGIAKAIYGDHRTTPGTLKGKTAYMAPEVIRGGEITRQADIFSAGVVLWEVLAGKRLFYDSNEAARKLSILGGNYPSVRQGNPKVSVALDLVAKKALEVDTQFRYRTALEFAIDIERAISVAPHRVVSEWVTRLAAGTLDQRAALIQEIESLDTVRCSMVAPPPYPSDPPPPYSSVTSARLTTPTIPIDSAVTPPSPSGFESRRPPRLRSRVLNLALSTVVLVTALGIFGALTYMFTHPSSAPQSASSANAPSPATVSFSSVAPSVGSNEPAQAAPPVSEPTAASSGAGAVTKPAGPQRRSRRAVILRRAPPRSTPHEELYLPNKL